MATITEDYVSFEIAKLLKEKGFDGPCRSYYTDYEDYIDFSYCNDELTDLQIGVWEILRPTLQMVMKWLLKKHNIFICILFLEESNGFGYTIENVVEKKCMATSKNSSYKKPENACDIAIKYCLENLI